MQIVKSLSCVWLFATLWTVARQAPPSTGFSRQEYWSGCHFLLQGSSTYFLINFKCPQTIAYQAFPSTGFSRQEYWSGLPFPSPGDLPIPGIEPRSPMLQADSLPAEPQGKPKNTGVGLLSLLQWIFPTQELNQGLPYCSWILYQLNQKGRPTILKWVPYLFSRGSSQPRN